MTTGDVERRAVRVVVLDVDDAVLLAHYITPDTGDDFWGTPGGALDGAEDHQQAARRELHEELGIEFGPAELSPSVAVREHRFVSTFDGHGPVRYRQIEQFHWMRRPRFVPQPVALGEFETQALVDFRWWTAAELETTDEVVSPADLARLVAHILAAGTGVITLSE